LPHPHFINFCGFSPLGPLAEWQCIHTACVASASTRLFEELIFDFLNFRLVSHPKNYY